MSELRKPDFVLLLKNLGNKKTSKVELFKRELFTNEPMPKRHTMQKYRLRVNGKWHPRGLPKGHKCYYASWEIKELFWRSVPF